MDRHFMISLVNEYFNGFWEFSSNWRECYFGSLHVVMLMDSVLFQLTETEAEKCESVNLHSVMNAAWNAEQNLLITLT